jgi:hypothetical protein
VGAGAPLPVGCANVVSKTATGGHLEVPRWAWEHDCPWNALIVERAATGGQQDTFRWAREHHCKWNARDGCTNAAFGGRAAVLKWAREHDRPWSERNVAQWSLRTGTCTCCSGRGSTTARGMIRLAHHATRRGHLDSWTYCSWRGSTRLPVGRALKTAPVRVWHADDKARQPGWRAPAQRQ